MPKARPLVANLNGGEASPLLLARSNIEYYGKMCRTLFNFVPLLQGGVTRRSGTRRIADVKDSTQRGWLFPFRFNVTQNYVIEAGDLYFRFYANRGQVVSAGVPVETVTPFPASALRATDFVQSADVLWLANPSYELQTLVRASATSFSVAAYVLSGGPFLNQNTDESLTVYASAQTGSVTLTASAALFSTRHVGSLIELQQEDDASLTPWESGKSYTAGDLVTSDGKVYKALNTATSGNIELSHDRGTAYDGKGGVKWDYQHNRRGVARITGYTGATVVTATVESLLPAAVVGSGNATYRWSLGSFSEEEGYPSAATLYLNRLVLAKDATVFGSVSGGYDDFSVLNRSGEVVKDQAFIEELASDQVNNIRWLSPQRALLAGTAGDEFSLEALATSEAFGSGNIKARQNSQYGSSAGVKPVRLGNTTIYANRSGVELMALSYRFESDNFDSENLNLYADHVLFPGVLQLALVLSPFPVVWALLTNGKLASLTYLREQGIIGWARHEIAGYGGADAPDHAVVESLCAIPDTATNVDQLWLIVRRTDSDGTVRRTVELMERPLRHGDDPETAFHVDGGLTLNNTQNAVLTPAGDPTARGNVVTWTASAGLFVSGDVGRRIERRYYDRAETDPFRAWKTAIFLIETVVSPTVVTGTVLAPFPDTEPMAAGGWRLSVTTLSGLDAHEGRTVAVYANGGAQNDKVVTGGSITLDAPAGYVSVGLPFRSVLEPLPQDVGSAIGTAQGVLKRIIRFTLRLWATSSLRTGTTEAATDPVNFRTPDDTMDAPPRPFTGYRFFTREGRVDDEQRVVIVAEDPGPCTVLAFIPDQVTHD